MRWLALSKYRRKTLAAASLCRGRTRHPLLWNDALGRTARRTRFSQWAQTTYDKLHNRARRRARALLTCLWVLADALGAHACRRARLGILDAADHGDGLAANKQCAVRYYTLPGGGMTLICSAVLGHAYRLLLRHKNSNHAIKNSSTSQS